MGVTRNADTYVPHMMTPQFKRFLRDLDEPETVEAMGFVADDLLEGSQYLEKARKLEPKVIGEPKDFDIGGRTITLTDGTIDELNEELARVFPEYRGKAYMDDPVQIGEAYVSSVARQAGRDFAMDKLSDSANPLVREVTGDLLGAVETRNKFLRSNPVVEMIKRGHTKGERLLPAKDKGEMPVTEFDDMFATTLHKGETKANRDLMFKEGKRFVEDVGADVSATRSTLAENLKGIRTQLMKGLGATVKDAEARIKGINVYLARMDDEIKKIGPLTSENVTDLVSVSATVDASMASAKAEIKKIRDRYGKKIPRDQARVERELQKTLRHLEDQAEAVRGQYAKGTREMRAEAAERKRILEEPIEEARKELDRAKAAVGPAPVGKDRVQAANALIRTGFETEDAFEAARQQYFEALNVLREQNVPLLRTVDGRLTPESQAVVAEVVAEIRRVEPPRWGPSRCAAVPEPPAAAAPEPPAAPAAAAGPPAAAPKPAKTKAKDPQQLLKTTRKMVKDNEFKLAQASTALDEAKAAGIDPERIRKLEYGVQQQQGRLNEARMFLADAERDAAATPAAAAPAAAAPEPEVPFRPPPDTVENLREQRQGLNNLYRDAVERNDDELADELERELDDIDAQIRETEAGGAAPAAAVPEVPPAPPAVPDTKLVRQADGDWLSEDGWRITNEGKGFRVTLDDVDDFGVHKTLKQAKAQVAEQQEISALHDAAAAARAAEETAVPPAVGEPPAPEPPAPESGIPSPPTTQRITRRWTKKDFHGKEVEAGPEGWTIEPYEESIRGAPVSEAYGYLPPGHQGPVPDYAPIATYTTGKGPRQITKVAEPQGPAAPALRGDQRR